MGSKMVAGIRKHRFDELPIIIDGREILVDGTALLSYTAFYDNEVKTWDVDYHYDGLQNLLLDEEVHPDTLTAKIYAALDQQSRDIMDRIADDAAELF